MIHAKELKKGDRVNFHEYGWQTVVSVNKHGSDGTKVVFDGMLGRKEAIFYPRFDYLGKVSEGLYIVPTAKAFEKVLGKSVEKPKRPPMKERLAAAVKESERREAARAVEKVAERAVKAPAREAR